MAESPASEHIRRLYRETGMHFLAVEKICGEQLAMPDRIKTMLDKSKPDLQANLKYCLCSTLALAYLDKEFPELRDGDHDTRGDIAGRMAGHIYQALTDGSTIEALCAIIGRPVERAKGNIN